MMGGTGAAFPTGGMGGALSGNGGFAGAPPQTGGFGGLPPGTGGFGGVPSTGGASGTGFPPVTDFAGPGSFTPTSGAEGPACTFFRPTVLGEGGRRHPVIVWGNGTTNTPANYTALFNHFASHGFIVAAANTSNAGSGKEMIACLDYAIAQNTAAGSPYEGHVDVDHIASSGYSQGGAGCLQAGIDPRFTVTAPVAPFIVFSLGGYDPTSVGKQTHPMFLLSGSSDTVAVPASNQDPIFKQATVPIVWGTHAGSTHFEVLGAGGAYAAPLTAWFRYKLMGDASAGQWFEKTPCTLCTTAGWTVQHNNLWQ
jgi:Chlorophyllase